jgi:hypothetical protein
VQSTGATSSERRNAKLEAQRDAFITGSQLTLDGPALLGL